MTKKVTIDSMPLKLEPGKFEFTVQLPDPAIARGVQFTLEERLVMAHGQPQFDEVLRMFVEFTPGAPMRTHRFIVMPTGKQFGIPEGYELSYVGSATSQATGATAHVYELRKAAS